MLNNLQRLIFHKTQPTNHLKLASIKDDGSFMDNKPLTLSISREFLRLFQFAFVSNTIFPDKIFVRFLWQYLVSFSTGKLHTYDSHPCKRRWVLICIDSMLEELTQSRNSRLMTHYCHLILSMEWRA